MTARLVRNVNPAGSSSPDDLISVEGILYFAADSGDGSGTTDISGDNDAPVAIAPDDDDTNSEDAPVISDDSETENDSSEENNEEGSETSETVETDSEQSPVSGNGSTATATTNGMGLWKSDGSEGGTVLLKSFNSVSDLAEVNGEIFFIAGTQAGYQLWKTDGTQGGTRQVKDLYPGADPNFPQDIFELDGVLFYSANDSQEGKYPRDNGYEYGDAKGKELAPDFSET